MVWQEEATRLVERFTFPLVVVAALLLASCGSRGHGDGAGAGAPPALSQASVQAAARGEAGQGVEVREAWSNTGDISVAAYMKIINHGKRAETVVGVSAGDIGEASLHRSVVQGDMARMEPVQRLDLPAGGTVELSPNGLHVMVRVAPGRKGIRIGDEWQLVLRLESGREIPVRVKARLNTIEKVLQQDKVKVLEPSAPGEAQGHEGH